MYGGTASEMARLVNESGVLGEAITVTAETINDVSFDKIIEAIHVVQTELEITGTTAQEAATTISGSLSTLKSSWKNLLTGMADDNADMGQLIGNFTESIETAASNLLPRIAQTISGIGEAVTQLAPFFVTAISTLITDVAPDLISAGAELADTLLTAFANSLGEISPALAPIGNMIIKVKESIAGIFETLSENIDWESVFEGMQKALEVVCGLIENIVGGLESLVEYATTEGTPLNDFFSSIQDAASQVVSWFEENWSKLETTFNTVKDALVSAGDGIIGAFASIVSAITENGGIEEALDGVLEVLTPLADAFSEIVTFGGDVATIIGDVFAALIRAAKEDGSWLNIIVTWVKIDLVTAFENFGEAIGLVCDLLRGDLESAFEHVKSIGENTLDSWKQRAELVKSVIESIISLIQNFSLDNLTASVNEAFSTTQLNVSEFETQKQQNGDLKLLGDGGASNGSATRFTNMQGTASGTSSGSKSTLPGKSPQKSESEFYASGAILTRPTAFAINPYTGKTMVGGESGAEAIAPIETLQSYVSSAVESKTGDMNETLNKILDALIVMNDNMAVSMRDAMDGVSLRMNNREFARAVKAVT